MIKIDLRKIVEQMDMSKKDIALQLFPVNKFPVLALNRVMSGDAVLDADQISKLSMLSGLSPNEMYSSWSMKSKDGILIFTHDNYRAELNMNDWNTKLFYRDTLYHDFILHTRHIKLEDYLDILNTQIEKK